MAKFPEIPDHPEIARALRTGHPRSYKHLMCADCGAEMAGSHLVYVCDGDTVCGACLKKQILKNYSIDDLAEAIGVRSTTVSDYIEEQEDKS